MATFEMFKPKIKSGRMIFNIKPLTDSGRDKLTDLQEIEMTDISLFIDDATPGVPSCFPNCSGAGLSGLDMSGQRLVTNFAQADFSPEGTTKTNLTKANLTKANLTRADLNGANLARANLDDAYLGAANLASATWDSKTSWPTSEYWNNTTCPDGTSSNNNPACGF